MAVACARTAAKSMSRSGDAMSRTATASESLHGNCARCCGGTVTMSGPLVKISSPSPWLKRYVSISQRPRMMPRAGKSSHVPRRRISISCLSGSQKRPPHRLFSMATEMSSSCSSL